MHPQDWAHLWDARAKPAEMADDFLICGQDALIGLQRQVHEVKVFLYRRHGQLAACLQAVIDEVPALAKHLYSTALVLARQHLHLLAHLAKPVHRERRGMRSLFARFIL
jgi:hypothetical protein